MMQADIFQIMEGRIYIRPKVIGFWSEPITAVIERRGGKWQARMSHSMGGREATVIESDLDAEANLAGAILQTVEFCNKLLKHQDLLEHIYQQGKETRE